MRLKALTILLLAANVLLLPQLGAQPANEKIAEKRANSQKILSLKDAVAVALEVNPQLSASRYGFEATRGLADQAGLLPNPILEVSVEDQQRSTRTTTTALSIPIELGGKRAARKSAARLNSEVAGRKYEIAKADVRAAVTARFFDVAVAQELVRVSLEMQEIAQNALRIAIKRVESGKVAPLVRNRAEVELTNARMELRQAESDLIAAKHELALLMGESNVTFDSVQACIKDLPPRPTLDELKASLQTSTRFVAGKLAVEASAAELEVEKSKRYPDITLTGGVSRDNEVGRNKVQIGVSIPLPLFDRNQGNVYAAKMQSYQAQDNYREMQTRLTADLLRAVSRYDVAESAARDYVESVLPNSRKAYEAARKGLEAGKFGYLEVLDAQRALSASSTAYLMTLSQAFQARADIDRLISR
ncbi:TolC family protein [Parapusillimonas sp. JC17]|uniref:TolC family protein n=1 Tax=Parapusillimonas sp. JC17 TaxID=3445768 RepID=UPI003FA00543